MRVPRLTMDMLAAVIAVARKKAIPAAAEELALTASAAHGLGEVLAACHLHRGSSMARGKWALVSPHLCGYSGLADRRALSSDLIHQK
jgi:hypothetical protein